jgi:adenosine kinase
MNIVVTGSVAFDYLMSFPGYFRDHILPEHIESISLSFLVDKMVRRRGGTAPNIAYTLALFGEHPRLLAAVGEDFEEYRIFLENKGIDTRGARCIPGVYTASFFANTDLANAQIATFYTGAMAYAVQLSLKDLEGSRPDLVMITPNDPGAMNRYVLECQEMKILYIYDPSQQIVRLSADDVRHGLEGALALFVNEYEFALVQKITGYQVRDILQKVTFMVVTRGAQGSTIYSGEEEYQIPGIPPEQTADPTGVGDAFRGGFVKAYCHRLDWDTCGRVGALAATYCLEQQGTQNHSFTPAEFLSRYRRYFNDQGKLDVLLRQSGE